jgi:hypothetical protein
MNISGIHKWLLSNKKKLTKEVATISLQEEKYELQALLEGENHYSKHEALLSDLIKLKQQLISILTMYDELYEVETRK